VWKILNKETSGKKSVEEKEFERKVRIISEKYIVIYEHVCVCLARLPW